MMFQTRRLIVIALLAVFSIACFFLRGGLEYVGVVYLVFLIMMPISLYWILAKTVEGNTQLTDFKTLEIGPTHLVITGPNWKTEMPWTKIHGLTEDDTYFYLHLSGSSVPSIIPKSAFSSGQQDMFRLYAQAKNIKK